MTVDVERRPNAIEDHLRRADRLVGGAQAAQDQDELVAAHPGDRVQLADLGAQAPAERDQQRIADRMAERVVDHLEAVEVEEQHGDHLATARALLERVREALVEQRAVREIGERVVTGVMARAGFRRLARGDVAHGQDEEAAAVDVETGGRKLDRKTAAGAAAAHLQQPVARQAGKIECAGRPRRGARRLHQGADRPADERAAEDPLRSRIGRTPPDRSRRP